MHAFDRKTETDTDRRTDRFLPTRPPCIQRSAVKIANFSYPPVFECDYVDRNFGKRRENTRMPVFYGTKAVR